MDIDMKNLETLIAESLAKGGRPLRRDADIERIFAAEDRAWKELRERMAREVQFPRSR